jgi:hypothetical protein
MTTTVQPGAGGAALDRPAGSQLAEVVDTILDKGLVIDAFVRVSLVGIEVLTVDARIVVAGVDTYLRFAEAVGRLDLSSTGGKGLPDLLNDVQEGAAHKKVKGAARGAIEGAGEGVRGFLDDRDRRPRKPARREESRRSERGEE